MGLFVALFFKLYEPFVSVDVWLGANKIPKDVLVGWMFTQLMVTLIYLLNSYFYSCRYQGTAKHIKVAQSPSDSTYSIADCKNFDSIPVSFITLIL